MEKCLAGFVCFVCEKAGLDQEMIGTVEKVVESKGGKVSRTLSPKVTHALAAEDFALPEKYKEVPKVHVVWIDDVSLRGYPPDPLMEYYKTDVVLDSKKTICVTGFRDSDLDRVGEQTHLHRTRIAHLIRRLGANWSPELDKSRVNYLVVPEVGLNSPKITAARNWGIPVVHYWWLVACIKAQKLLPTEDFEGNQAPSGSVPLAKWLRTGREMIEEDRAKWMEANGPPGGDEDGSSSGEEEEEEDEDEDEDEEEAESKGEEFEETSKKARKQKREKAEEEDGKREVKRKQPEKKERAPKKASNFIISYSSEAQHDCEANSSKLKKMGGSLITYDQGWNTKTTHYVVTNANKRSAKLLSALASGSWVLDVSWVKASVKAQEFQPEEEYIWSPKDAKSDGKLVHAKAVKTLYRERKESGNGPYDGWVVLPGPTAHDLVSELIPLGGGRIVSRWSEKVTLVVVGEAPKGGRCQSETRMMANAEGKSLPVVLFEYVFSYLSRHPRPTVESERPK